MKYYSTRPRWQLTGALGPELANVFPGANLRHRRRRQDHAVVADHRVPGGKISGQAPAPTQGHPSQGQGPGDQRDHQLRHSTDPEPVRDEQGQ